MLAETPHDDKPLTDAEEVYYAGLLGTPALAQLPVTPAPDQVAEAQYRMDATRMLPEVPCSVNLRFAIRGQCDSAQATGRGWTAAEAAHNLKATIDATRALLEAPQAPTLGTLLEKGLACAVQRDDPKLAQRLMKAAWYVTKGAVTLLPDQPGVAEVQGSQAEPYQVHYGSMGKSCGCPDWEKRGRETGTLCVHQLATAMLVKMQEVL